MQRSENRIKPGRVFKGMLWLRKGCFASDDGTVITPSEYG
jgi:hypothetical protein